MVEALPEICDLKKSVQGGYNDSGTLAFIQSKSVSKDKRVRPQGQEWKMVSYQQR